MKNVMRYGIFEKKYFVTIMYFLLTCEQCFEIISEDAFLKYFIFVWTGSFFNFHWAKGNIS